MYPVCSSQHSVVFSFYIHFGKEVYGVAGTRERKANSSCSYSTAAEPPLSSKAVSRVSSTSIAEVCPSFIPLFLILLCRLAQLPQLSFLTPQKWIFSRTHYQQFPFKVYLPRLMCPAAATAAFVSKQSFKTHH